jgi:hypothetical protein
MVSEYKGAVDESVPTTDFTCFDAVITLNATAFG